MIRPGFDEAYREIDALFYGEPIEPADEFVRVGSAQIGNSMGCNVGRISCLLLGGLGAWAQKKGLTQLLRSGACVIRPSNDVAAMPSKGVKGDLDP